MEQFYKVLGPGRTATHGGSGTWPEIGEWTEPVTGTLKVCKNGYHVVTLPYLRQWVRFNSEVYLVETDTEIEHGKGSNLGKSCTRLARLTQQLQWNHRIAVAWGLDSAERVLHLFEQRYPDDKRVRQCIETTRAWLRGEASLNDVRQAHAAADAAYAAAAAAARYAADAATAAANAYYAASTAADAAAYYAADAAADAAYADADTGETEIVWQNERLRQYLHGKIIA